MALKKSTLEKSASSSEFLKLRFLHLKGSQTSMTMNRFAEMIGVSSSFLKMYFTGRTKLTIEKSFQISKALSLTAGEHELFQELVLKDRGVVKPRKKKTVEAEKGEKFLRISESSWLHDPYIIPVTIYIIDMKLSGLLEANPDELARLLSSRFSMSFERVAQILATKELKTAVFEEGGFQLIYEHLINITHQKNYLKYWMGEAVNRLAGYPHSPDRFNSATLTLASDDKLELFAKIKSLVLEYSQKKYPATLELELVQASVQFLKLNS